MLPYACNFVSIGCDFTRWGIDGDRNRVSPRIRYSSGDSLFRDTGTKKFIVSSCNNIFYIQIHHFTQQAMLNQSLYHTIQSLEPNTKSKGGGDHPLLVADVTKKAWSPEG